jgi:hypothetical protein
MVIVVLAFVALVGCGSRSATSNASLSSTATGTTATPVAMSAAQAIQALAGRVRAVKPGLVYTAATDPNEQLGRPGSYGSAAAFIDSGVSPEKASSAEKG